MVRPKKEFGGEGSGNWGHEGRPGERGGSMPGGGGDGGGGNRAAGEPAGKAAKGGKISDKQHNAVLSALANDEESSDKELHSWMVKEVGLTPAQATTYVKRRMEYLNAPPGDPLVAWRGKEKENPTAGDWQASGEPVRGKKPGTTYPGSDRLKKAGVSLEDLSALHTRLTKEGATPEAIASHLDTYVKLQEEKKKTAGDRAFEGRLKKSIDAQTALNKKRGGLPPDRKPKKYSKEFAMIRAKDFTIFKAGHWNGETFTEADLDEMVKSFDANEPIPIIVGHSSDYRGHTRIPAFGRIMGGLRRVGGELVAIGAEFNESLANWIKEGFYNQRSIELTRDNKRVLALGMLGAVPPAVKGLPGNDDALAEVAMQFSEDNKPKVIMFAEDLEAPEMEEEVAPVSGSSLDEAEQMAIDDTFKTLSEACARFLEDVEKMLENGEEMERVVQEVGELQADLIRCLGMHAAFVQKIEKIEEGTEEYSQRPGWKQFVATVKHIFKRKKEASDMDKQKEKEYNERIEELEAKVKEFQETEQVEAEEKAKAEAEAKAKAEAEEKEKAEADTKAIEDAKTAEVKQMCDALIKDNRMTPAMRQTDEPIMLTLLKKDTEAYKAFCQKYSTAVVPLGTEPALNDNSQKPTDQRPLVIRQAAEYAMAHPKEFAGLTPEQAISQAMWQHSTGKIKFEDKK